MQRSAHIVSSGSCTDRVVTSQTRIAITISTIPTVAEMLRVKYTWLLISSFDRGRGFYVMGKGYCVSRHRFA
jgi:hypothetical protein